jgi:LmbE family N-acetylglucosaminyl deacetylase
MRLFVSAHLDDAVLSCGSWLQSEGGATVYTIFAGFPPPGILTPYDEGRTHLSTSEAALALRRAEDREALKLLGLKPLHGGWLDDQYDAERPAPEDLAEAIVGVAAILGADEIVGPLGVRHPDHVLLGEAMRLVADERGSVLLYEDAPYRALWPEDVAEALDDLWVSGRTASTFPVPTGLRGRKWKALLRYATQVDQWDRNTLLGPECCWYVQGAPAEVSSES